MALPKESVEAQARVDELRRRLYRHDASDEDLERYAAERAALGAPLQDRVEPVAVTASPRRPRALVVAPVAVLLAAGLSLAFLPRPAVPTAVITPTPTPSIDAAAPSPLAPPQDIGDGRTLTQDAAVVTVPAVHVMIHGTGADAEQYAGMGNAVVPLDLSEASVDGGSAVVMLSPDEPIPVAWRALRLVTRRDWTSYQQVLAEGTVYSGSGPIPPIVLHYVGAPPARVAIEAPYGVHWTLGVAFMPPTPIGHER